MGCWSRTTTPRTTKRLPEKGCPSAPLHTCLKNLSGGIPRPPHFSASHDSEQITRERKHRQELDSRGVSEAQHVLESRPEQRSGETLLSGHVADSKWPEGEARRVPESQAQTTNGEEEERAVGESRGEATDEGGYLKGLSTDMGSAREERGALSSKVENEPQSIEKPEEWFSWEFGLLLFEPDELVCRKNSGIALDAIMGLAAGDLEALARVLSEV
jgi:hypothetical protein